MKSMFVALAAVALTGTAFAKLPAPSEEAKAKAAEAAAKTAHAGKVDAYQLCKAQDRVVARTSNKTAKPAGKDAKAPAAPASTCVDPGPFVYTPAPPAAPASAPSAAVAMATPASAPASAPSAADKPKK